MKLDLHFSSAPAFLWRHRGRRRREIETGFVLHWGNFYIKYLWPEVARHSPSGPLRELSLANYLLFRLYLTPPPWKVNLRRKINFINKKIAFPFSPWSSLIKLDNKNCGVLAIKKPSSEPSSCCWMWPWLMNTFSDLFCFQRMIYFSRETSEDYQT